MEVIEFGCQCFATGIETSLKDITLEQNRKYIGQLTVRLYLGLQHFLTQIELFVEGQLTPSSSSTATAAGLDLCVEALLCLKSHHFIYFEHMI